MLTSSCYTEMCVVYLFLHRTMTAWTLKPYQITMTSGITETSEVPYSAINCCYSQEKMHSWQVRSVHVCACLCITFKPHEVYWVQNLPTHILTLLVFYRQEVMILKVVACSFSEVKNGEVVFSSHLTLCSWINSQYFQDFAASPTLLLLHFKSLNIYQGMWGN